MFISDSHLPQILSPHQYTSQEQFELEKEKLLMPSWHCVGALGDLPNDGDYVTTKLLDRPLILWNKGGEIHTFLNVCAHRFTTLRDTPCGHLNTLHCQYHGWEYDCDGDTQRIPDAKSFKPMAKGALGLKKYRTEMLGRAIYVCLDDNAPSLQEQLGPGYEIGKTIFSLDRREFLTVEYEVDANWKVKVENTLESYHLDLVHPKTFGHAPDESICKHELESHWTTFATTEPPQSKVDDLLNRLSHRIARRPVDYEYKHFLYYPSVMFMKTGLVSVAESVFPIAPNRSRVQAKLFCYPGPEGSIGAKLNYLGMKFLASKYFTKVAMEDAGILPCIQRGLEAGEHPSRGLISIREERLYHFQKFIQENTVGSEVPSQSPYVPTPELV